MTGKTIIPGCVDIHAHMWPNFGIHRTQVYEYLVNLAYGVTTTRDPQTSTTDVLSYSDLVETGALIGPRIYSTGPGLFDGDQVSSQTDANEVMKRYSEFYKTETIKQYMTGERMVRQLILMAASEQKITPTLEGGLDFKKNLTEAIDGYAGQRAHVSDHAAVQGRGEGHRGDWDHVHADAHRAVRRPVGGELLVREVEHP